MTNSFKRLLVAFIVILLSVFNLTTPAFASGLYQGHRANLTIEPLKPLVTGDHPTITVHLTAEFGQPIHDQPIIIRVDGIRKAEGKTDSRGVASIVLKYKFDAATYHVEAIYPGIPSIGLPGTIAKTDMIVEPAKVAIYTVPPVPGVSFKLNNQIVTSDENGVANIEANASGIYSLEVLPINKNKLPSNVRMEFTRWNDNVFTAKRQVYFPRARRLEAGFTVSYQVNQKFYDSKDELVDPARVSFMSVRGVGNNNTFNKAGLLWLPANRLTRRIGERLETEEILYYFTNVTIDGANVINKSEQRFHIRPNDVWPIHVLLYSIHFSAQDAMFHFPIGKGIELTYPDGHKKVFLFDSHNAEIVIPSLARGSYSSKIIGAGGSAPATPVHLSRDQDVDLLMLSYLDIILIVGIPLSIAIVFFFTGRPRWLGVLRHPSKYRELAYRNAQRDASLKP